MGIAPGATTTRVLAMRGASETLLKARLSRDPVHPRALSTLLEAIALWQGMQVRAALAADDRPGSCDSSLYQEAFNGFGAARSTRSIGSPRSVAAVAALTSAGWVTSAIFDSCCSFEVAR